MAHIDTIVAYVADELDAREPGRDREALIADARVAVAAVRRFDLRHSYRPLNERAWRPPAAMIATLPAQKPPA